MSNLVDLGNGTSAIVVPVEAHNFRLIEEVRSFDTFYNDNPKEINKLKLELDL